MPTWLIFALSTVACWGVYGVFLHMGGEGMMDKENGRYKAFLLVGLAYFVVAVLAPIAILAKADANLRFWEYPFKGLKWSFIAGVVGAAGAFFVLRAFGAGGKPPEVMSIVFAGAPIVNALVALTLHPPKGGWDAVPVPFYLGIVFAAVGGYLVVKFKPGDPPKKKVATVAVSEAATGDYAIHRRD